MAIIKTLKKFDTETEEYADNPWTHNQRLVMIFTAFLVCFLCSGITIGNIAFRELLLSATTASHPQGLCRKVADTSSCILSEIKLAKLLFSSSMIVKLASYPVGLLMQRAGPRIVSMVGCLLVALGVMILAFSDLLNDALQHIGIYIMGIGGMSLFVPSLQLCRIMPNHSKLLMSLLTCCFDSSSIIFVLLLYLKRSFGGVLSVNNVIGLYTIVPIICFLLVTSFYPDGQLVVFKDIGGSKKFFDHSKTTNLLSPQPQTSQKHAKMSSTQELLPQSHHQSTKNVKGLLHSPKFWIIAIYTAITSCHFTFYLIMLPVTFLQSNLPWEFQRDAFEGYSILFALGSVMSISAVSQFLDSFSIFTNYLIFSSVVILWLPLIKVISIDTQALGLFLLALFRPYYYSLTNQLCAFIFDDEYEGENVYGKTMFISGLFEFPILAFIHYHQSVNVQLRNWITNLAFLILFVTLTCPVYLVYQKQRRNLE